MLSVSIEQEAGRTPRFGPDVLEKTTIFFTVPWIEIRFLCCGARSRGFVSITEFHRRPDWNLSRGSTLPTPGQCRDNWWRVPHPIGFDRHKNGLVHGVHSPQTETVVHKSAAVVWKKRPHRVVLFLLWSAILLSLFVVFIAVNTDIHLERYVACFALVFRRSRTLADWPLKLPFIVCKSVHRYTFNRINQQDAATSQV